MTTSVSWINPRLISAVSGDPAELLAAAAAELAKRWTTGDYDLADDDAVPAVAYVRDAIESLAALLEPADEAAPRFANVNDCVSDLAAETDRRVSPHAEKRATEACIGMRKTVRELSACLDRHDSGLTW